jgi:salicylate hydroxylase
MNLTIVGAGIGGLTAAIALARDGNTVRVLEQTPQPKPVGAGISLQPNAMKALARLGLDHEVIQRGCASALARVCFSNGNSVQELDFSTYINRYGYLPHTIHRADLFDLLFEAATESGVEVCFGEMIEARLTKFSLRCPAFNIASISFRSSTSSPQAPAKNAAC